MESGISFILIPKRKTEGLLVLYLLLYKSNTLPRLEMLHLSARVVRIYREN